MTENDKTLRGAALKSQWNAFIGGEREDAFYAIYTHYHDYFIYLGNLKGFPLEKTKDCINDLFLHVFEHRDQLGHVQHHHNYLVTSFLRRLFRKNNADENIDITSLPDMPAFPSVEAAYIQQATHQEVYKVLQRYMDALPRRQSKIIYQKFYLALSYEEIALANGITVKTAYNTVYNAIGKLKKLISKHHLGLLAAAITLLSLLFLFFSRFL